MAKKDRSKDIKRGARGFSNGQAVWRYTLLFIAVSLIIFFPFITGWRTLLWMADGYHQHIKALIFYSDWLKAGCPADYSFSLGYGRDIISTMQHYCLGEPLAALSYFVPREYMLHFYCGLSVFRHYLAGLAFTAAYAYIRKGRASVNGCTAGAIIYAYCGYAIHFGLQHPMFVTPMIYLPLMILGIEKYLRERKPGIFIISVFLSGITDFYFLYILGLGVIAYYFIFGSIRMGKTGLGGFIKNGFALLALAVVGACLSGIVLIPTIYSFLADPRTGYQEAFEYFYSLGEIARMPEAVLSSEYTSRGMILGVGALTVPAGFMLITGIRKHPGVFVTFIISLAALTMPVFAFVSNGFSEVNNRWIFIEALILAVMDAVAVDELRMAGKLRGSMVFLGSAAYIGAIGYLYFRMGELDLQHIDIMLIVQAALVLLIALIFLIVSFSPAKERRAGLELVSFLGIVAVAASGCWHFADIGGNWATVFMKPEEIDWENGPAAAVASLNDDSFFRYEFPDADRSDENSSDLYGLSTTGYYYSLSTKSVSDFMTDMAVTDPLDFLNCYHGLDGRAPLLQMAAVKYYVSEFGNAPYGFDYVKKTSSGLNIYRNTAPVSMVHSYTGILNTEAFDRLSVVDQQYAILSGALIRDKGDGFSGVYEIVTPRSESSEMKYSVTPSGQKAVLRTSGIKVSQEGATLVLKPADIKEGEYSLLFEGLTYEHGEYEDPFKNAGGGRVPIRVSFVRRGETEAENTIQIFTKGAPAYRGQDDYLVSSKWAEQGIDKIILTFTYPGEYRFGDMGLYHVDEAASYGAFSDYLKPDIINAEMNDETMKLAADEVSVSARWAKDSIVCFSIPLSEGWTCTIDGEPAEILTVNGMYMGVEVSAGSHEILMHYQCPMKLAGFIATVSGAAVFALIVTLCWNTRRKERKKRKAEAIPETLSGTADADTEDDSFESVMKYMPAAQPEQDIKPVPDVTADSGTDSE